MHDLTVVAQRSQGQLPKEVSKYIVIRPRLPSLPRPSQATRSQQLESWCPLQEPLSGDESLRSMGCQHQLHLLPDIMTIEPRSSAAYLHKMPQTLIPTLHHLNHSTSHRCLWALEELKQARNIEYKLVCYERQTGQAPSELKRVFPLGKSPILTLESTTDEPVPTVQVFPGVLTEGQLILRFLSDEYGQGLWDPAKEDKNRDLFFQGFAVMTLATSINHLVIIESPISALPVGLSSLVNLMVSPITSIFKRGLTPIFEFLEDALSQDKPFFSGSKLGLADFDISWGMDITSQRGYFDASKFPKLHAWHEKIKARLSYRAALEIGSGYDLKTFGL
ncbi:hypothetical protein F5B22DRAFT_584438 [Xylaria bambusicola]|uniref:uncharacterized protein n=1 Tax=Xylaria bambusicola TaxID=326684 RepID=UPI002008E2B0|nr:uncharacterized protein F5B22DRAFT_584438 [Xylaria bambusicola]KAI0528273.1 hypothetical protein F5B22DRAFT_584438 [Xylaria bambusicola]